MKKFNSVSFAFQLLVIGLTFVDAYLLKKVSDYYFILHMLLWLCTSVIFFLLFRKKKSIKNPRQRFEYIIVFVIFNLITTYLIGFVANFQYSAYSHSAVALIKNFCQFIVPIVCYEMLRQVFVSNAETKADFWAVAITMTCVYIDMKEFVQIFYNGLSFSYLFGTIVSSVITQIFLNYLVRTCGLKCTILWQIVPIIAELLTPILPKIDWFYQLLLAIAWPLICFVFLYYTYPDKNTAKEVRFQRKKKPYGYITTFVAVFLIVGLGTGMFGVSMTAIASNSMNPYFYRGDIVVVTNSDNYQVDDVIEYQHGNMMVVHRIVEIDVDENGDTYFVTKGDNNNANDSWAVTQDQIKGKVKFIIPKVGYLTLWLSEMF